MEIDANHIETEIKALHIFFEDWFGGKVPKDDAIFAREMEARFPQGSTLIPPGGRCFAHHEFLKTIYDDYGKNPAFRVAIRNVRPRALIEPHLFCVYEEWQRGAVNSKWPDNGRVSTVIFTRDLVMFNGIFVRAPQ